MPEAPFHDLCSIEWLAVGWKIDMKAYASFIAGRWLSGDEVTKNVNPSDVGVLYRVGQNGPPYRGRLREAGEEEPTRNGWQESNGRTR